MKLLSLIAITILLNFNSAFGDDNVASHPLINVLNNHIESSTDESEIYELAGEISSLKTDESIISIKYLKDEEGNIYDNTDFSLPANLEIVKNGSSINLQDLRKGDQVIIVYHIKANGLRQVKSIVLE